MCRHLGYLGPPVSLASLVIDPPHSLREQASCAREATGGPVNADGFGVGWYTPAVRPEPARYRRAQPIWTDASFASLAAVVASGCVVAAVRKATPGFPVEESGAAPFTSGRWLFSLNGSVDDWPRVRALLAAHLPPGTTPESPSDSAMLWAVLHHRLSAGEPVESATFGLLGELAAAAGGRLNLLVSDGERLVATAWGNSLYVRDGGPAHGVAIASEPLDDDRRWARVPDRHGVVVTAGGVTTTPLTHLSAGSDL